MSRGGQEAMQGVTLIGCGYVADLYMRSLAAHPEIEVLGAYDKRPERLAQFCTYWTLPAFPTMEAALASTPRNSLIVNLASPSAHAQVIRDSLEAGRHVFSEKPMVMTLADATRLTRLAADAGLQLASAPSSVLGRSAQGLMKALRDGRAGTPRLIYAELDEGFIPQAPLEAWASESGAPWPWEDEFRTGNALEHAGYHLSWLIAAFGRVTKVSSAIAEVLPDKRGTSGTADLAVALLHFKAGPVARLTCSITASHDHRLRVFGDFGVLEVPRAWDNAAPVLLRKRRKFRRRLVEGPLSRSVGLGGSPHPMLPRKGAARMNFALGPAEMLAAIAEGRPTRLGGDYALHLTEVTLAVQAGGAHQIKSGCAPMEPMPWAV